MSILQTKKEYGYVKFYKKYEDTKNSHSAEMLLFDIRKLISEIEDDLDDVILKMEDDFEVKNDNEIESLNYVLNAFLELERLIELKL